MKQNMQKLWSVAAITVMLMVGCSDGELTFEKGGTLPSVSAPIIFSFAPDRTTVQKGESVTLNYKVSGADTIQITGVSASGSPFKSDILTNPEDAVIVEDLQETMHFVLSATNVETITGAEGDEIEEEATSKTQPVQVVVIDATEFSVTVIADMLNVASGEASIIRWIVSGDEASTSVTADKNADMIYLYGDADCKKPKGDIDALLEGERLTEAGLTGCAVVYPEAPETTYTVTAIDANGNEASGFITIRVTEQRVVAEIFVDGSSQDQTVNAGQEVVVSWNVQPEEAVVTVAADGDVNGDCQEQLPTDATTDQTSATCIIYGDTTFKLRATAGETTTEDSILVRVSGAAGVGAGLTFRAQPWAFPGEKVSLTILPESQTTLSLAQEIRIGTGEPFRIASMEGITLNDVVVPPSGLSVSLTFTNGQTINYPAVVSVMPITAEALASDEAAVTRVAFDINDISRRYRGVKQSDAFTPESIKPLRYYENGGQRVVDVASVLLDDGFGFKLGFLKAIADYPVTAIAARPGKPNELYVGTTSMVLRSEDNGATWSKFTSYFYKAVKGNESGTHVSCGGKELKGIKAGREDQLIAAGQICDLAVRSDGRIIIATDRGVYTIRSIDTFLQDWKQSPQIGMPKPGSGADDTGFKTYGHVVSDIEDLEEKGLTFVATDRGVYVSRNGGESFEAFGALGETHAISAKGEMIYAGTADGKVSVSSTGSAQWREVGSAGAKILSLAADPMSETLIVGTMAGAKVSRNGGVSFSAIPAAGDGEVNSVVIAAEGTSAGPSGMGVEYSIMIGSASGAVNGQAHVVIQVQPAEPSTPQEKSPTEE